MPIHPVYYNLAIIEDTSNPEYHYNNYHWPKAAFNCDRFDSLTDPSFYDIFSHDYTSNEDLSITAEHIRAILEEWRVWDAWDRVDHLWDLIEKKTLPGPTSTLSTTHWGDLTMEERTVFR